MFNTCNEMTYDKIYIYEYKGKVTLWYNNYNNSLFPLFSLTSLFIGKIVSNVETCHDI